MALIPGFDSASVPTNAQAQAAYDSGHLWWGFYIQGVGNTDPLHAWSPGEEAVLTNHSIKPVPICIPSPVAVADPVQCATQAFNSCKSYGLSPKVSVCYNGEHIAVGGPVWIPLPGAAPTVIGSGSAIQYGGITIAGIDVDLNLAAPDFPMSEGIVCDLEHNAGYTSQWYASFQQTIASLAMKENPTMLVPLPTAAYPIKSVSATTDTKGRWDVWMLGNDGHVYQVYFTAGKWQGPTVIS